LICSIRVPQFLDEFLAKITQVQLTLTENMLKAKEVQMPTRPLRKLDFIWLGPFRIDIPLGNDVYCLLLPADLSCLHLVFHTSLWLQIVFQTAPKLPKD
ncbi:hypothetical protein VP01_3324g2, partial [Puccinia sorghi]